MPEYKAIRCAGSRPHIVKENVFDCCGSLMVGVNAATGNDFIITCRVCKSNWHIETNGDGTISKTLLAESVKFKE